MFTFEWEAMEKSSFFFFVISIPIILTKVLAFVLAIHYLFVQQALRVRLCENFGPSSLIH